MFYAGLRQEPIETTRRVADGLARLRTQFREDKVPQRTSHETLLLATWNVREFGESQKLGPRLTDSFYYIAEIIDHFDLVAMQEVRDIQYLDRLVSILGSWWKYLITDVTAGASGNQECLAFLYDSRKVVFDGLAGEIVLPDKKGHERRLQFARTPFLCGFKSGWTRFQLCTVHIYYGKGVANDPRRVQEIHDVAEFLSLRYDKELAGGKNPPNIVLLGDFNIFKRSDETMKQLTDLKFTVPEEIQKLPKGSNLGRDKYYDQIAVKSRQFRFGTTGNAGVFDYYKSVYRDDQEEDYSAALQNSHDPDGEKKDYGNWRTFQMSDHLLLWVELRTDFADNYLEYLKKGAAPAGEVDPTPAPARKVKKTRRKTS